MKINMLAMDSSLVNFSHLSHVDILLYRHAFGNVIPTDRILNLIYQTLIKQIIPALARLAIGRLLSEVPPLYSMYYVH